MAESGRNAGAGPGLGQSSSAVRFTPTGRVSRQRVKRWNGRTKGKGTATDALKAIEPKVPKLVNSHVGRAIRKTF